MDRFSAKLKATVMIKLWSFAFQLYMNHFFLAQIDLKLDKFNHFVVFIRM